MGETRGGKLQFAVVGPNLNEVGQQAANLQRLLSADPAIGRVDLDVDLNLPQIRFDIQRDAVAKYGLTVQSVAETLNLLSAGSNIAQFNEGGSGTRYDVRLKAADSALTRPEDLQKIYLRNQQGEMIRLDSVLKIERSVGPTQIERQNLLYSATLKGSPTVSLSEAVAKVEQVARDTLPPGYRIEKLGEARELERTGGQLLFVFGLASLLLYMILASQFNSFAQPAVIMLAEPLAVVGGLFALWWTGNTLNTYSVIGLILLIGLVAKNAILLVDEALAASCPMRLRPVLMTSLTVILAMFPAALGLGAGAETNGPLSIAVIGGMLSSTLLTLVVVPAAYSLLENALARRAVR